MARGRTWSRRASACRDDLIALYDDEIDEEHAQKTSDSTCNCLQCMFLAKKNRWRTLSCMACDARFTWLMYCTTGLGCVACWSAGLEQTELAKCQGGPGSLRYTTLLRHTESNAHRKAESQLFERTMPNSAKTPSPKDFKSEWAGVRTGKANTLAKNRPKRRLMEWCLAEAIRTRQRSFLQGAATVSLNADARQGRLLMRWSGTCKGTLEVRQGVLGLERDFGTGSEAYKRAMAVIIERICTPGVCQPLSGKRGGGSAPQPRDAARVIADPSSVAVHDSGQQGEALDVSLLKHVQESTQMVVADGAGDGHIAFDDLRKSGVLPNVIVRHYDQAHGARRLTSRPWYADDFARDVVETMVYARESLCMIISNSEEFQKWLKSNMSRPDCKAASLVNNNSTSAGVRKHRWDSTYVPLVRAVLGHRAMTRTALQIASARKGDFQGIAQNISSCSFRALRASDAS